MYFIETNILSFNAIIDTDTFPIATDLMLTFWIHFRPKVTRSWLASCSTTSYFWPRPSVVLPQTPCLMPKLRLSTGCIKV